MNEENCEYPEEQYGFDYGYEFDHGMERDEEVNEIEECGY
jgi:hypothetical protein